jgi:hypothetical protein
MAVAVFGVAAFGVALAHSFPSFIQQGNALRTESVSSERDLSAGQPSQNGQLRAS